MDTLSFTRILRTPHSERYIIQLGTTDAGSIDIHYVDGGKVVATIILMNSVPLPQQSEDRLIQLIDDQLLPDANRIDGSVIFTVVRGSVVNTYLGENT